MRLREFIEKRTNDEIRGDLMRAIDLAKNNNDMIQANQMIHDSSDELDNEDWIFVQQHFDKKNIALRSHEKIVVEGKEKKFIKAIKGAVSMAQVRRYRELFHQMDMTDKERKKIRAELDKKIKEMTPKKK